jgi:hypothetical protein
MGVELRRASRDVHGRDLGLSQRPNTELGRLSGHGFTALGTGIHMTVTAGLVAQLSDVDLKHGDAGGM